MRGGSFNYLSSQELCGTNGYFGENNATKMFENSFLIMLKCRPYSNVEKKKIFGLYFHNEGSNVKGQGSNRKEGTWNSKCLMFVFEENQEPFFLSNSKTEKALSYELNNNQDLYDSECSYDNEEGLKIFHHGKMVCELSICEAWGYIYFSYLEGKFKNVAE